MAGAEHLGRDLLVAPFLAASEWDALDLAPAAGAPGTPADLAVAVGTDCLRQALLLRLLTPLGALGDLGHAGYGSRLHELVGQELTDTARLRARAFVLQAVAQERRVAEVLALAVEGPDPANPHLLRIALSVRAASGETLVLGLEVATQ